ncbi:MAG: M1 family metallopeptidase [Anaerolineales bacterium]|nr:M1 family metallopeptidase [Anaerolineales bacterium]MCZ2287905.1 M1 family metallopeptidase [Anaerolineales bacterium]
MLKRNPSSASRLLPSAFRLLPSAFRLPPSASRLLLFAFCLLLAACSPSPAPPITPPPVASSPVTPPPVTPTLDTPTPSSTPPPQNIRPQYALDVQFNYANKTAIVDETIVYVNNSADTLTSLVFGVEATCSQSFTLNSVSINQSPISDYVFDYQNVQAYIRHRLEVPLPQPLPPNGQATVQINFGLILPVVGNFSDETSLCSQIYGYTAQQVNLVDWYPFIVPYVTGKGWVLHNPWYYGEHLTFEAADFDVRVEFTDGSNPVIAASGEEVASDGAASRRFRLEAGRNFALSFAPEYRVLTKTVGDVVIYSYYFPPYETAAAAVLNATAQSFEIYSQRFGSYIHKTLSVVQGDFNDGMEYSALYYHSKGIYNNYDGTLKNHLTAVSVHETAHQWWFEQVGNDQGFEPWLDEALATYSEIVYYETVQPDALKDWWWIYRFDPYKPLNQVDARIYEGEGQRPYWNKVYLNGAHFLQDLRARIRDEAFFAFLQDYLAQMRGKIATTDDFFRILREHTSADLSDLIAQYFQNPH